MRKPAPIRFFKYYSHFCERSDMTFITKECYDSHRESISIEVTGWYFGEPNPKATAYYCDKGVHFKLD